MRAGERALRRPVAAALARELGREWVALRRPAGDMGERRTSERRVGKVREGRAEPLDQPAPPLRQRRSGFGELSLERIEPARIGLLGGREEPIAFAQRGFVARGVACVVEAW